MGLPLAAVRAGLAGAAGVPGRVEPVDAGQPFSVLVDYSHTPDSLANVLRAVRAVTAGRLLTVFGCGGDRDRGKRPAHGGGRRRASPTSPCSPPTTRAAKTPWRSSRRSSPACPPSREHVRVEPDRRAAIASRCARRGPATRS